jgi:hypothetical protein
MVATVLLSTIALGLTTTLVQAQRVRAASERWMLAIQLAAEGIEHLRAGQLLGPVPAPGFERSGGAAPWDGHLGLQRLEVTVSWDDGQPHRFQLITLARR